MNIAIDALRNDDTEAWQSFVWLGVLSDDAAIAAPMAATLWNVDEATAVARLQRLRDCSLLLDSSPVRIKQHSWPAYRLSQDLSETARHLLMTQTTGLGISLVQAHAELLRRYQRGLRSNLWHTIADDGYIHAHLTWHLEQAEWTDKIHQLLHEAVSNDPQRNGWYEACVGLAQPNIFAADVSRAWRLAEALFEEAPSRAIALQCRYALMGSILNNSGADLAEHLPVASPQALTKRQVEISDQELI